MALTDDIETFATWIAKAKHAVFFTGAGISTDSGLPDFRGPDGVWTRRDKGLPPPKGAPTSQIRPNAAHASLVELEKRARIAFLISQNVDGLHLESGFPQAKLAELHGNGALLRCLACDEQTTHERAGWDRRKLGNGYRTDPIRRDQPPCPGCGGRLISSVVNFGDPMPVKEMEDATAHTAQCDLFVVVGSSLVVSPANDLPQLALYTGAKLVLLNRGETPFDAKANLRFDSGIADVLPPAAARVAALV